MASFEHFILKIKPSLDMFLRVPNREHLHRLRYELTHFNFMQMKIFHVQILAPLVLQLEELNGANEELMTGTLDCIRIALSKLYLDDVRELRTLLVIIIKQIRESGAVTIRPYLTEELKLSSVHCIAEALRRSSSDVLESFYTQESAMILGQILLTLVELIEGEKYRKLVITSLECLMTVFYVHDEAEFTDVVLRNQVADTTFIFLPKIVTVLLKSCLSDEKTGETLKSTAIKALGRILCVVYDHSNDATIKPSYDKNGFKSLIREVLKDQNESRDFDADVLGGKNSSDKMEDRFKRMQDNGRSKQWFNATSRKLRTVYAQTSVLRSHDSVRVRTEYAHMCCTLIAQCARNLGENYMHLLENIVAMSQDQDTNISKMCADSLLNLQQAGADSEGIFEEYTETLFDEHLAKLPRIIHRCDDSEQYAELIFLKGFLCNLSAARLHGLLLLPTTLEMLCRCLLSAVDMRISRNFLLEEYALRQIVETDIYAQFNWRLYKHLNSERCARLVKEICMVLGNTNGLNRLLYDYLLELLIQDNESMNEILLVLLWMATGVKRAHNFNHRELVDILLEEVLKDKHWYLALQPDENWRIKVNKPTDWFVERTPGLYESAVEIRTQDLDSDDEKDADELSKFHHVTILDAEFNILHTCLTLDVLGHCALFYGDTFSRYLFRCLHKVLLKVASSNTIVYQAANFCLVSIQRALKFAHVSDLIETHTDYLSYHLNSILKRSPESPAAVEILTVVLQLSNCKSLPHFESIFQTIRDECSKSYQSDNINAFLRVFNAFLTHIKQWQTKNDADVAAALVPMEKELDADPVQNWLDILEKPKMSIENGNLCVDSESNTKIPPISMPDVDMKDDDSDLKPELPRHIEMVRDILNEVLKFVGSVDKTHQLLALDCLISGVPLLRDYEDELLPLVHLIWSPLMEKFRNKQAIVLNRSFMLLDVLATHAKEFILKRSIDDVIPFLQEFLRRAAKHNIAETSIVQTQEYKLQVVLLKHFANLIMSIQIDGKHLNEIAEIISLYLAKEQPKELQELAIQFYKRLHPYNAPFVYMIVIKKLHIHNYKENVEKVLTEFGVNNNKL